jgi:DHA1 family multidrug resistance protein-like MFS transporter
MQEWKRTYAAVFAADLITAIGMMSFLPFFPSYLTELGVPEGRALLLWTGVVFGAAPLSAAVMGPLWGSIGDLFGRKAMVLRALVAIATFVGCMSFVTSPWQLLALRVGQGVFSGFVAPSITLVSVAAPREVQGRIAGTLQSALAAGSVVGPLAGAALTSSLGVRSVFLFVSGAALLGSLLVALLARETPITRVGAQSGRGALHPLSLMREMVDDLRSVVAIPALRVGLLLLFLVQFGLGATRPLLQILVARLTGEDLEAANATTGSLFSALALAMLVATPLWGRLADDIGGARVLFRSSLGTALVLAAVLLVPSYPVLVVVFAVLGLVSSGANVAAFGLVGTDVEIERRGNAFGAMFSARAFAAAIGAVSGGALASLVGLRGVFVIAAGLILLALAVLRPVSTQRRG